MNELGQDEDNGKCDRIVKTLPYILKISELRQFLKVSTWAIRGWAGLFSDQNKAIADFPKRTRMPAFRVWLFDVDAVEKYLGMREGEIGSKVVLDPLLTVKDVSKKAGRTEWTVYQWVKEGKLKAIRIGHGRRIIRIIPHVLEQFVTDHKDWLEDYSKQVRKKRRRRSTGKKNKVGPSSKQVKN